MDIAFYSEIKPVGIGYVMRDDNGIFLAKQYRVSMWKKRRRGREPRAQMRHPMGATNIGRIAANIIIDAQYYISSFDSLSVTHVDRSCNKVAHLLATSAHHLRDCFWEMEAPTWLLGLLLEELITCNIQVPDAL
ncbi:hypothetical protein IFM89_002382 [Coptis chinensis]|uniref:RNase H type-1 domain-containing protein n=1 Tax=Coptis chinensis TaxID=261450 RepID=A0A835ILI9_9MAGN|nr:hypothetical protein IFM89_002382 [Coptis chinensis]